jgi:hypothetical protein
MFWIMTEVSADPRIVAQPQQSALISIKVAPGQIGAFLRGPASRAMFTGMPMQQRRIDFAQPWGGKIVYIDS